jgi:hypothetical protein
MRPVSQLIARPAARLHLGRCWLECIRLDRLELAALQAACDAPIGGMSERLAVVDGIRERRRAAERKLWRAQAEADGLPWLEVKRD